MNTMKVSTRMLMLIGLLSSLLMAVGALGLFGLDRSNSALQTAFEGSAVPAAQLGEIRGLLLRNRLAVAMALVTPTAEVIEDSAKRVETNIARVTQIWDTYRAGHLTEEEQRLAASFTEARRPFVQEGLLAAVRALRANDVPAAQAVVAQRIRPLFAPVERDLEALVKLQIDQARTEYEASNVRNRQILWACAVTIAVGLAVALGFGLALVRSITAQLGAEPAAAADVARRVAAGRLDERIAVRPGDAGSLMVQLRDMQDALGGVVARVRQNAESVASASTQIAQGNLDLSSRTEEQASALQQTAASMEQLSSTVQLNAENAREANRLAQAANEVAQRGGHVVGQVVGTMRAIDESARQIADIVGTIDGIAFQTNLLALNAAVEAARAGEQGRGFAVVANEVRILAGRSATAAREIKALIGTSVDRVEQGSALVGEAGTTMQETVAAIERVTALMAEISAASAEQSTGVAQVGEAVSQMDQATQQNAALVEESAAAAESLRQQAQQLVEAVAVFRVAAA